MCFLSNLPISHIAEKRLIMELDELWEKFQQRVDYNDYSYNSTLKYFESKCENIYDYLRKAKFPNLY